MRNTCTNVCRVRAVSNHEASIGKQKSVLQRWIRLWFQLVSCQSSHFSWNHIDVWYYPWSVQVGHKLLHGKCLNYNQLKPKSCPAVNSLSFCYAKTKCIQIFFIMENRHESTEKQLYIFLLLNCKIICTGASFSTYHEMKQEGSAPVALDQTPSGTA